MRRLKGAPTSDHLKLVLSIIDGPHCPVGGGRFPRQSTAAASGERKAWSDDSDTPAVTSARLASSVRSMIAARENDSSPRISYTRAYLRHRIYDGAKG